MFVVGCLIFVVISGCLLFILLFWGRISLYRLACPQNLCDPLPSASHFRICFSKIYPPQWCWLGACPQAILDTTTLFVFRFPRTHFCKSLLLKIQQKTGLATCAWDQRYSRRLRKEYHNHTVDLFVICAQSRQLEDLSQIFKKDWGCGYMRDYSWKTNKYTNKKTYSETKHYRTHL